MLPILHQDAHLIAIDKPAGLLVHRTGLDAGETRFAVQLLRDQIGQPVWPLHRLDKGTSGVLLFALSAQVAGAVSSLFESNEGIAKTYRAVVRGWPPAEGVIDHPLTRLADDARATARALTVQPARTRFRTLGRWAVPCPMATLRRRAARCWNCNPRPAAATSCAATASTSATRSSATPRTARAR
ncbi:pseudouridine synthase [Ottowia beijingensis]|uniref:pseudouridine synthase n=1 Tax=Ottowia beijingensis TaxID=1207057 RepID=UPI0027DA374D|nr:pseudouridine synthase [Ottowia beijingensis]